jgi:DNA-binding transcriptional LysR family regulator
MELRELGYFLAVFEENSVSAAARRCFISQPSVSAALAALEAELGIRLFVRHRRGTTPTPAATQLYPVARRLVDEAGALRAAFRPPPTTRRLTIGLMRSLDAHRTRELLHVMTGERDLQLRLVAADERCDLRIISRGLARPSETFVPLWSERYAVALPADHPLALRDTVRAADLVGQPLVERCHCEHARAFARRRTRRDPVAVAASEEWALALVGAGVGIAIVPEGSARDDHHVVLRPIRDVGVTRQVGVAWRTRARSSLDVQRICDKLRQRFAAPPARTRRAAARSAEPATAPPPRRLEPRAR